MGPSVTGGGRPGLAGLARATGALVAPAAVPAHLTGTVS